MDRTTAPNDASGKMFPSIDPFDTRMLGVGDGHSIYVEQCGNPDGIPVVVLHGGPGGGCSPMMRRFFDPAIYRVVLFDQRGCGRSKPHASVDANTTWHLVADIERIRDVLGIPDWVVFGGSWGATLSLIYAQTHPDRVRHLILRGVFLMTQGELDWFYGGGAGKFWPELWAEFCADIPKDEHGDLIAAYNRRLFTGISTDEARFAVPWATWENALASIDNDGRSHKSPAVFARAFARLENHYFHNKGFIEEGQILRDMPKIAHITGSIVQGRYDMICPPATAQALHKAWPQSDLHIVPRAGHAMSEPGISAELVRATARFAENSRN